MSEGTGGEGGPRDYYLLCVTGLLLVMLGLVLMRLGAWVMFPSLVGVLALAFRWRFGVPLVLLALALLLATRQLGTDPYALVSGLVRSAVLLLRHGRLMVPRWVPLYGRPQPSLFADVALAAGGLMFAAGYCRLQGILVRLFPPGRPPAGWLTAAPQGSGPPHRRPGRVVSPSEVAALLLALPLCAAAAEVLWWWVAGQRPQLFFDPEAWQGLLLLWLVGVPAVLGTVVLRYLALRQQSPEEAALFLQDVAWRETRREQRRQARWLAWARLQRSQGEKQS